MENIVYNVCMKNDKIKIKNKKERRNISIDNETYVMAQERCKEYGMTFSGYLIFLIRQDYKNK